MKLLSVLDHSSRPRHRAPGRELDLAELALVIDRHGIDAIASATLRDLAGRGRLLGLGAEVAGVLTDPSAPAVVRERVFGLIRRRSAASPSWTDPTAVAA